MRPNYKNIAIATVAVGLIFLTAVGAASNQNNKAAETKASTQAEVSPLPADEEFEQANENLEQVRKAIRQKQEEAAAATASPVEEQQSSVVSDNNYAPENNSNSQSVNSPNTDTFSGGYSGGDKDCGDFATHAEAQAFF